MNFGPSLEIGREEQGWLVAKAKAGTSRPPGAGGDGGTELSAQHRARAALRVLLTWTGAGLMWSWGM